MKADLLKFTFGPLLIFLAAFPLLYGLLWLTAGAVGGLALIVEPLALIIGVHLWLLWYIVRHFGWLQSLPRLGAISLGTSFVWVFLAEAVAFALVDWVGTASPEWRVFELTLGLPVMAATRIEWVSLVVFQVLPFSFVLFAISAALAWLLTGRRRPAPSQPFAVDREE